jgi:hypothetical protein
LPQSRGRKDVFPPLDSREKVPVNQAIILRLGQKQAPGTLLAAFSGPSIYVYLIDL